MPAEPDKILLLGVHGQVGNALLDKLHQLGTVAAYDFPDIDFARPESLRDLVRSYRPDIIVNAAAYTAVDKAESEPELAHAINAEAPTVLAAEAAALGGILVHYSTDYVYDGKKPAPYVETDPTGPLSVYGRTKLAGDEAVQSCPRHLVFRTSWVISAHGRNFVKSILRLAGEKETFRVVADQIGAPTSAALLAESTVQALHQVRQKRGNEQWGIYHLTATGSTSWHGLARLVLERGINSGFKLKTKPDAVEPISTAEYPCTATRPANSRLDTGKVRAEFSLALADWSVGVHTIVDQLAAMGGVQQS